MHNKSIFIIYTVITVAILGYVFAQINFKDTEKASSSPSVSHVTLKGDWELGNRANITTTNPEGSIKLNDAAASSEMDLTGVNFAYDFNLTHTVTSQEAVVDLGSIVSVAKIYQKYYVKTVAGQNHCQYPYSSIAVSSDGITYGGGDLIDGSPAEDLPGYTIVGNGSGMIRFIKYSVAHFANDEWCDTGEEYPYYNYQSVDLKVFLTSQGTHTTAPTQIDGGANFWSWDSNAITQSVSANTTATYQYRSSPDGSTWTSWVGAIGSVTNRTGDDSNNPVRYRYLQVKATLSNTDGVSTPTIDSYDIGYHTEQKSNKPTAVTAVVQ